MLAQGVVHTVIFGKNPGGGVIPPGGGVIPGGVIHCHIRQKFQGGCYPRGCYTLSYTVKIPGGALSPPGGCYHRGDVINCHVRYKFQGGCYTLSYTVNLPRAGTRKNKGHTSKIGKKNGALNVGRHKHARSHQLWLLVLKIPALSRSSYYA